MHYGVDYYPEQWDRECWETQVTMIKGLGLDMIRFIEFAWEKVEPEKGIFDFDWLDEIIDLIPQYHIKILLGLPTTSPPDWLVQQSPQKQDYQAKDGKFSRQCCVNSPVYQQHAQCIVTKMAEHYGKHPAVAGWQIEQQRDHYSTGICYCDNCANAFREWLRHKYTTLDRLYEAWGREFLPMSIADWNEIPIPQPAAAKSNPSLLLDYYRFRSDSNVYHQRRQIAILRQLAPHQIITHNIKEIRIDDTNLFHLAEHPDAVCWDNFLADGEDPIKSALSHDLIRSLSTQSYQVIGQQGNNINQNEYPSTAKPEAARLWMYQALAHGATRMTYFQGDTTTKGQEPCHRNSLKSGEEPTRTIAEISKTHQELRQLERVLREATVNARVAVLYSFDNQWALSIQSHNREFDYRQHFLCYYRALWELNIPVDIVPLWKDLSQYGVVIAPTLFAVDETIVNNLEGFVKGGGCLISTLRSGMKDWNNRAIQEPLLEKLRTLLGVETEDIDSLNPCVKNRVRFVIARLGRKDYPVNTWTEILKPHGAEVLAEYQDDFCRFTPAVTRHRFGRGFVFHIGCISSQDFYNDLFHFLLEGTDIHSPFIAPKGVEIGELQNNLERERFYVMLNHNPHPETVYVEHSYSEPLTKKDFTHRIELLPYDVKVLQKKRT